MSLHNSRLIETARVVMVKGEKGDKGDPGTMESYNVLQDLPQISDKTIEGNHDPEYYGLLSEDELEDAVALIEEEMNQKADSRPDIDLMRETVMKCAASYLVRNHGSDKSINQAYTDTPLPLLWYYKAGAGNILAPSVREEPRFKDEQEVEGVNYNLVYMDCICFVVSCLMGREWENSAYKYGIETANPIKNKVIELSSEVVGADYEWTMDFLGNYECDKVFRIFEGSMNYPYMISRESKTASQNFIDTEHIANLKTGDVLLFGASSREGSGVYRGCHHIALYIKDLEDLNKYCRNYGVTANCWLETNDNTDYGYLIDVWTPSPLYNNTIRIKTLWSMMNRHTYWGWGSNNWFTVYSVTPQANAMNSNKKFFNIFHGKQMGNVLALHRRNNPYDNRAIILDSYSGNVKYSGEVLANEADLDDVIVSGRYKSTSASLTASLLHCPVSTGLFTLDVATIYLPDNPVGAYVVQRLFPYTGTSSLVKVYIRTKTEGSWTDWVSVLTDANDTTWEDATLNPDVIDTTWASSRIVVKRSGNVCEVSVYAKTKVAISALDDTGIVLATLGTNYRSAIQHRSRDGYTQGGIIYSLQLALNGQLQIRIPSATIPAGTLLVGSLVYLI